MEEKEAQERALGMLDQVREEDDDGALSQASDNRPKTEETQSMYQMPYEEEMKNEKNSEDLTMQNVKVSSADRSSEAFVADV